MAGPQRFYQLMSGYTREFEDRANRAAGHPSKKSVHELRIAIRRIRCLLWVLRKGSTELRFKKLNRVLREWSRALGQTRELDVAIKDAKSYGMETSSLKKRRRASRCSLKLMLTERGLERMERRLMKALNAVEKSNPPAIDEVLSLLRFELARWRSKRVRGRKQVHRLRIAIKRSRYILEALGKDVRPLTRLQEVLGDIHDLDVLKDLEGDRGPIRKDRDKLLREADRLCAPVLKFAIARLH